MRQGLQAKLTPQATHEQSARSGQSYHAYRVDRRFSVTIKTSTTSAITLGRMLLFHRVGAVDAA